MPEMIVTDPERRSAAIAALHSQNVSTGEHLIDFADSVLIGVDELDPEDLDDYSGQVTQVYDSAVPVYTAEIMETIREDLGLMATEPELGPAFDGEPTTTNIAASVLYELGSRIAGERVRERQDEIEEAELEAEDV